MIPYEKRPYCRLVGEDGNAYAIIARVSKALCHAGFEQEADDYKKEAMSGDYDNLLVVSMSYVREGEENDDDESHNEMFCDKCDRLVDSQGWCQNCDNDD